MPTCIKDLSDTAWEIISKILNQQRKRKYSLRAVVNGILSILRKGTQWRNWESCYPHGHWFTIILPNGAKMAHWKELLLGIISFVGLLKVMKKQRKVRKTGFCGLISKLFSIVFDNPNT